MTFWRFNFGDGWLSSPARWGLLGSILLTLLLHVMFGVSLWFPWTILLVLALVLGDARQRTGINVSGRLIKVTYPLGPWRPASTFPIDSYDMVGLERVDPAFTGRWFRQRDSQEKENWRLQLEGPEVEPLVLQRFSEQPSVSFELRLEREAKRIADRLEFGFRKTSDGQVVEKEAGTRIPHAP